MGIARIAWGAGPCDNLRGGGICVERSKMARPAQHNIVGLSGLGRGLLGLGVLLPCFCLRAHRSRQQAMRWLHGAPRQADRRHGER